MQENGGKGSAGKRILAKDFFTQNPVGGSLTAIFGYSAFVIISGSGLAILLIFSILQKPFQENERASSQIPWVIDLLNQTLSLTKHTHSRHNNCKTQEAYLQGFSQP